MSQTTSIEFTEFEILKIIAFDVCLPIEDLQAIYNSVKDQNRMYAVDIRQFAARGIEIYTGLAKVLGVDTNRVANYIEAGKVGFNELKEALKLIATQQLTA